MRYKTAILTFGFLSCSAFSITIALIAQGPSEAPAGFTTPALANSPGSQSISNGLAEPPGDTFQRDQEVFEQVHDPSTGLGPVFNASSCVSCHANPVTGSASQFTEIRIGHLDDNGNFVNPTITINDGQNTLGGRSLINDRAICAQAQEHVPAAEGIRTLRAVLNTLGDGFVEAIGDNTLIAIAQGQPAQSNGFIRERSFRFPFWKRRARLAWRGSDGRISTAACFPSLLTHT